MSTSARQQTSPHDGFLNNLSRLENGENDRPAPEILQRLADVLELDASTLLRFIGIRPRATLPSPRIYFRRKLGVNAGEADILAKLIEDYQAKRREDTHDNTNQSSNDHAH